MFFSHLHCYVWFFRSTIHSSATFVFSVMLIFSRFFKDAQSNALQSIVENLLAVTRRKVRHCAESCVEDAVLFSHLLDECVTFENELHGSFLTCLSASRV